MLEQYKTVLEGGEGEIIEKKISFYRYCETSGKGRRGPELY